MAYNQGGYQPPYGGGQGQQPPYQPNQYGAPPQQPQYGAPPPNQQYGAPPPQQYGQPPNQQYNQYPPQNQQYGQPPPQQQYNQPPQQYNQPPQQQYNQQQYPSQNQPPNQYGAPPPQQHGQQQPPYGAPPPQQYGQQPQYGAPPPGQQPYGAPPQQNQYGAPPPNQYGQQPQYGQPQQQQHSFPPTPPSLGYGPAQHIQYDASRDAEGLRKAMKGFGTDEKALIKILADKDALQINAIRQTYTSKLNRQLISDVESEVSGWFEKGLVWTIRGPLQQDVWLLHDAMDGVGTKETVLNDVLLGRSNADIRAIKEAYQKTYRQSLESAVKADLSMKTERHFLMVLAGNRNEDSMPVNPQEIDRDVTELYKATEGKVGTDELLVCNMLTQRNNAQLAAIAHSYKQKFTRDLESVIKKEFSGHMEDALLYQLRTATDKAMRDATLLEDAMSGAGTKDALLTSRVIRAHWDRNHMQQVKGAYQHKYHRSLSSRIKSETSGDYEKLLVAWIGE